MNFKRGLQKRRTKETYTYGKRPTSRKTARAEICERLLIHQKRSTEINVPFFLDTHEERCIKETYKRDLYAQKETNI